MMWIRTKMNDSIRKNSQIMTIWKFLKEFCNNSTVHGVRYFTEQGRHWSERFWWIFAIGFSMWLCSSTIQGTWIKWRANPMSMGFAEKEASISDIPFPTVTICPETKTNKSILDLIRLSKIDVMNISWPEERRLIALAHICSNIAENLSFINSSENEDIYDVLTYMALSPEYVLGVYKWQHERKNTDFASVLTEKGLCFAFNSINSDEIYTDEMAPGMMIVKKNAQIFQWNLENGYSGETNEDEYPLRLFNFGKMSGLNAMLHTALEHLEYICQVEGLGYTVFLSTPGESLGTWRSSFRVPLLEDFQISIKPKLITTSEGLRSYSPNQRQCFYNGERQLRFFKFYTQDNCEAECLANFTKIECGCVKFHMPRDNETNICGGISIKCYNNAEYKISKIKSDNSNHATAKSYLSECNCLPACTSIEYAADITNVKYDMAVLKNTLGNVPSFPTRLTIFFKNHQIETIKRMETYTYVDFMAICGGLLGLFSGVSALSVIEFIYYFTLRLYWTIRRSRSENVILLQVVSTIPNNSNESRI